MYLRRLSDLSSAAAWARVCVELDVVSSRLFELLDCVGRNGAECDETRFTHLDNSVMR